MEMEEHSDCPVEKGDNTSNGQQAPETPQQINQEATSAKISTMLFHGTIQKIPNNNNKILQVTQMIIMCITTKFHFKVQVTVS